MTTLGGTGLGWMLDMLTALAMDFMPWKKVKITWKSRKKE